MKVPMGPPPPRNFNPSDIDEKLPSTDQIKLPEQVQPNQTEPHVPESDNPMPENPNSISAEQLPDTASKIYSEEANIRATTHNSPYSIPPWSDPPGLPYFLEVLKDGTIVDNIDVSVKGAYMFGRVDQCDLVLEHPSISRFHSVLQFKKNGEAFIYDLGSTHGTFINKGQVKQKVYTELHVGDVIRFGHSSRLYIFQGPSELMPPERDLKILRNTKIREDMQDREASLLRARIETSVADGISWGMAEDAIEEITEDDAEEVTWQTYKGQLTERQEKTRDKIIKRTEKLANMKKEIDAIQAKEIAQGGLTQGQQTQIARNEQRISQIMEELESLEETLNDSIQESISGRARKLVNGKKKGTVEDEDAVQSDDDEFYDRTKKKPSVHMKAGEQQVVETADTLLDKKESVIKEMDGVEKLLLEEKTKVVPNTNGDTESGDALDSFMTGLSSQLVVDVTTQLQKKLDTLQSELNRIQYLLKFADPTGEAAQRRDLKPQLSKYNQMDTTAASITRPPSEQKRSGSEKPSVNCSLKEKENPQTTQTNKPSEDDKNLSSKTPESKIPVYSITQPQWLGATQDMELKESQSQNATPSLDESSQFVDYKDRKKALALVEDANKTVESMIEDAGPGLIIRKRKQVEEPERCEVEVDQALTLSSETADTTAADAVALLLKHERGLSALDDEEEDQQARQSERTRKEGKKSRRVLGPEKPAFLDRGPDYETWVPPQGQTGDGRTSLNDRYGY